MELKKKKRKEKKEENDRVRSVPCDNQFFTNIPVSVWLKFIYILNLMLKWNHHDSSTNKLQPFNHIRPQVVGGGCNARSTTLTSNTHSKVEVVHNIFQCSCRKLWKCTIVSPLSRHWISKPPPHIAISLKAT